MIGYILSFVLLIIGLVLDKSIAGFFYSHQSETLTSIFSIISDLGTGVSVALIATLALAFLSRKEGREGRKNDGRKNVLLFWASLAITLGVTYILKISVLRERPISFYQGPYNKFHSFPSGHTSAVFCALPFMKFRSFGVFWLAFSSLVAFSRIYLGFHYLSDVVAGGLLGYVISEQVIKNLSKMLEKKGIKKVNKRKR
jgi:membrane-associated phospholipid phosphatase